jgi:hypothetical protein
MKKRSLFLIGFFILALVACGSNHTNYTDDEMCRWQTQVSYETCMDDIQDCKDIAPGDEAQIQCMATKGYRIPTEDEIPTLPDPPGDD